MLKKATNIRIPELVCVVWLWQLSHSEKEPEFLEWIFIQSGRTEEKKSECQRRMYNVQYVHLPNGRVLWRKGHAW